VVIWEEEEGRGGRMEVAFVVEEEKVVVGTRG